MGLHDGHRSRMKDRFVRHGLENFDDLNVLELLLFYALPRRDTNVVAHALLDRFGSLSAVLEADMAELCAVPGVGESAGTLLHLIPAVSRRYMVEKSADAELVDTPAAAGRYFIPRFMYETEEVLYALFLDARKKPIVCRELSRGVVDAVEIHTRRLVEMALARRASAVILAHNHLSGSALPSAEDETTTRQLTQALSLVGVELADHVIVSGCDYVSMREALMV